MQNNMLDWHFSFTGVEGSPYEGGVYHGTISLSSHYPRKAPIIRMKTPSGRWKVNEEICLSGNWKLSREIQASIKSMIPCF